MPIASILFGLEWWMDNRQRDRQAEIQGQRELDVEDDTGDDPPEQYSVRLPTRAGEGPHYTCRVCGFGASENTFCLQCLADTMIPSG